LQITWYFRGLHLRLSTVKSIILHLNPKQISRHDPSSFLIGRLFIFLPIGPFHLKNSSCISSWNNFGHNSI
uniref:Cytochrome b n=1 Tax=Rodentolepis nana TaxID=102285 RepID=A0A0R3TLV8_RODNA